jgi:hypothetical protein
LAIHSPLGANLFSAAMEDMKDHHVELFVLFKRWKALLTPVAVPALAGLITQVRVILLYEMLEHLLIGQLDTPPC